MRLFCSKNETCPLLEHLAWFLPNFQGCDQFLRGLLCPCDIQWSPKHLSKICFWTFVSPGNDQGSSLEAAGPLQPWEEKDKGAFIILIPDGREVELGIQALPSHSQPQGKRVKIEIQEIPFNITKSFLLWERLNPGIHFPERLWALHPWRNFPGCGHGQPVPAGLWMEHFQRRIWIPLPTHSWSVALRFKNQIHWERQ